jgi:polar amino acid transport system ATP-binding protein
MSLVSISNVHKYYGDLHVLQGIDLTIKRGEVVCIIGRSGSGKSTLLRCMNGLERYDQGTIILDNKEVSTDEFQVRKLSESVGMVFQSFNLFPHLTVGENVMLAPRLIKHQSKDTARQLTLDVLTKVGLENKFGQYPEKLSGGQQQRVAIARSLAMNPKVLLCDEITSALDPELVGDVLKVLETLAADGMTLVLVTHEMNFARDVGDRVVFMNEGKVWESGPAMATFAHPQTPELSSFLGALS